MAPRLSILYVEDNPIVREVTAELLVQDDREIVATETAEEALEAFAAQDFDIVITDVSLPVMSGLELVKSLLALNPTLPVIIASGYAVDFGVRSFGPNVRSVIKPFESSVIDAMIAELTHRAAK